MTPASTNLVKSVLAEGGLIFAPALCQIQWLYPIPYPRTATYKLVPSGPDYEVEIEVKVGVHSDHIPIGWAPGCR